MLAAPPSDADGSDSVSSSSSSSSWFSQLRHTVRAALSDLDDQSASPAGSVPSSKLPAGHSSNDCNPCVLFATQRGCFRGHNCLYCHEEHLDKPKVAKRLGCVSVLMFSGVQRMHVCM